MLMMRRILMEILLRKNTLIGKIYLIISHETAL